ncbi:SDR family NAD(P)-dependent oxidoreductase [Pseudorhodoferax sp.]|uniref:SDR family NAD(P)-dependent oxidoreductase n=1 Tax=Pseudorhodoferax sp. TaxID=1993553 RepID=UPI0039E6F9EE
MRLKNKLAIVTAGGSGMGRAGCELFAREGAKVAVVDYDKAKAEEVAAAITGNGGSAKAFVADLSQPEECRRVIAESAAWLGGVDLLWAHAGMPGTAKVEGIDMDEYRASIDLNMTSALISAAEVAPHMRQRGGGAIVFTSSIGGLVGSMHSPVYSMAKFGVVGLTMSLAQRFAADGIRVNAVCPGPIDTPMLPKFFGRADDHQDAEANRARLMAIVPMGRAGRPEEVAHAALWLLSDDASFVTGVPLPVDGGYLTR